MEKTYNARLSFKGEGSFTFTLPGKGEITIYQNKDIYVKGLSVSAVEALRNLRPLLLDHKLNASSVGCYSVIDLNSIVVPKRPFIRVEDPRTSSISDLKASLIKSDGPIVEDNMDTLVSDLVEDMKNNTDENLNNKDKSNETQEENDKKEDNKKDDKKEDDKVLKSIISKSNSRGKGRTRNRK